MNIIISKSQINLIYKSLQNETLSKSEIKEINFISKMLKDIIEDTPPYGISKEEYNPEEMIFDLSEY